MDWESFLLIPFVGLIAFGFISAIWRRIRSGSAEGALLGGRIRRQVGQVELESPRWTSRILKVLAMETDGGEPFVGFALQSRGPGYYRLDAVKLSAADVQDLIWHLQESIGQEVPAPASRATVQERRRMGA